MATKTIVWALAFCIVATSLVSASWAPNTEMTVPKTCSIPLWELDTDISGNVNKGEMTLKVYPICCGVHWNPATWYQLAVTQPANLLRCDYVDIRVINYFGDTNQQSSDWQELGEYFRVSTSQAINQYNSIIDFMLRLPTKTKDGSPVYGEWGMILDGSLHPIFYRNLTGGGMFEHTINLNKTGTSTIQICIEAREPHCNNRRHPAGASNIDPECLHPVAIATPNTAGYDAGWHCETITVRVVESGGIEPGTGTTTGGSFYQFIAPDSLFIEFKNPAVVWWLLTLAVVGGVLVMGGGMLGSKSKGSNSKLTLAFGGFVALLMIFVGGYLGAISWTYFMVIGVVFIAVAAYYGRQILT